MYNMKSLCTVLLLSLPSHLLADSSEQTSNYHITSVEDGDNDEGKDTYHHEHGEDGEEGDWMKMFMPDDEGMEVKPPSPFDKAATARWITHNTVWGSVATIAASTRERPGLPFANPASFSDGPPGDSTGKVYFLHSPLDATIIDVMENDSVSFAISEMQTGYCQERIYDAEDPRCARLSLGGRLIKVEDVAEIEVAKTALFSKHPSMVDWYNGDEQSSHHFGFYKLELEEIWLVDFFGGAALIDIDAWNRGTDNEGNHLEPSVFSSSFSSSSEIRQDPDMLSLFAWLVAVCCAFASGMMYGRSLTPTRRRFKKVGTVEAPQIEIDDVTKP